jgi:hypothetical protein
VDKKAAAEAKEAARKNLKLTWWQPHDYRRNGRSFLSRKVDKDIGERVLSHVISGVRAHYDVHDYAEEKAHALRLWADELQRILSNKPAEVTDLDDERQKRGARGRS